VVSDFYIAREHFLNFLKKVYRIVSNVAVKIFSCPEEARMEFKNYQKVIAKVAKLNIADD